MESISSQHEDAKDFLDLSRLATSLTRHLQRAELVTQRTLHCIRTRKASSSLCQSLLKYNIHMQCMYATSSVGQCMGV